MQEPLTMAIEWWPLDRVRPYPGNPRTITEAAITKVAASIRQFGWRQPLVVDEAGEILVGHTRRLAAIKLGFERVPVHVAAGLTPEQARAYRLADNRVGEETEWDLDLLKVELRGLEALDSDLGLTGFDDETLADLLTADEISIEAEAGAGAPGSSRSFLSFGQMKVPVSEDELARLLRHLSAYTEQFGTNYGFAAWLCEARDAA